jgi:DNA invertase Pin-like site-specific DNA recombinase
MTVPFEQCVTPKHLARNAYLYVRQSTLKQVCENTESTMRQYALQERAVVHGWSRERIIVVDDDLGQSGASSADRHGFQRLVSEVSLGRAGIVLGLEVSRLARNCADWHKLLEICALTNTLILDEDGLYDPGDFNHRLLLGMKGTFSEAELHVLRARLRGGILSKARRGELRLGLPTGFVYDPEDHVVLDPDDQVQRTIRYFFETFRRTQSVCATVRVFRDESLRFPCRLRTGPRKGQLEWGTLTHSRACYILHNQRYAGVFVYGRTEQKRLPDGLLRIRKRPMDEWVSCVTDAHDGYVDWSEFLDNQRILRSNAVAHSKSERAGPPREGSALLQGLVVCGLCGRRMTLRYHERKRRYVPDYVCQRARIEYHGPLCQFVPGGNLDDTIAGIVEQAISLQSVEVTLAVQAELDSQAEQTDRLRRQCVERAQHEVELARERYMCVDARNRLVAGSLEQAWNEKLRILKELQEQLDQARRSQPDPHTPGVRQQLLELVNDFPRIWNHPSVEQRDRKRIVRLLIEDVTVAKDKELREIHAHIRFKGGATRSVKLDTPVIIYERWKTKPHIIKEVDKLLDDYTESQIADMLNNKGIRTSHGRPFRSENVAHLRRQYQLRHRRLRLRDRGFVPLRELAAALGVSMREVKRRAKHAKVETVANSARDDLLYRARSTQQRAAGRAGPRRS